MNRKQGRERQIITRLLKRIDDLQRENESLRDEKVHSLSHQARLEERLEAILTSTTDGDLRELDRQLCARDALISALEIKLHERSRVTPTGGIIPAPIVARPSLLQRGYPSTHVNSKSASQRLVSKNTGPCDPTLKQGPSYRSKRTDILIEPRGSN